MAKAVRFYNTGAPEVLRYEDVEVGDPGPGQVRLRHVAVGLNFADTYFRNGTYPVPLPNGLGVEAAGIVTAVGLDVEHSARGDRVSYTGFLNTLGAYSTERLISAAPLIKLPKAAKGGGPGWGKAKSVVMVYLQGGPSHLDLWDPKENVPDKIRSPFKNIKTQIPGINFTEVLPNLAKVNDKLTMIRSMSYTPNGLFNHTAAIYQIMTGYTTDKVSPSGQLEPPNAKDYPNFGSNIIRLKPPTEPMLPFVRRFENQRSWGSSNPPRVANS